MSSLSYLTNILGLPSQFRGDFIEWIFEDYFDVPVYMEVLYIILIYYGPGWVAAWEKQKQTEDNNNNNEKEKKKTTVSSSSSSSSFVFTPIQLFNILWNAFLSLFSLCGAAATLTLTFYKLQTDGFYLSMCGPYDKSILYDGELAFWIYAFLLSKFPEMIDTVLLVLQRKPLIFLHWYHHLTVSVFCWYAGRSLIASGVYFATMNYCVHAVMYSYYLCCSLRLRWLVRPLAPLITAAQLLQMVVGTAVVGYTWYHSYVSGRGCEVDRRTIRMGVGMYGSYVVLFALLFVRLYLTKGKKQQKRQQQKEEKNGKEMLVEKKKLK